MSDDSSTECNPSNISGTSVARPHPALPHHARIVRSENQNGRLAGKRVLITGTSAVRARWPSDFSSSRARRVIGCDLRAGAAEESAKLLREEGHDARGYDLDLTDPGATAAWVETVANDLGGIHVLHNTSAGFGFSPFGHVTIGHWWHVMRVEIDIIFPTTRVAWTSLSDGDGSIINTGSYSALRGIAPLGQVPHAAAMGGVIAMTRSLATEGARYGFRANSISPGFMSAPSTDAAVDDAARAWQLSSHLISAWAPGLTSGPGRPSAPASARQRAGAARGG